MGRTALPRSVDVIAPRDAGIPMGVNRGMVAVTCWCEARIVAVPIEDMWFGQTRSCGLVGCEPGA